ncbi:MAG: sterol desaturase family protein [Rubellimicrobium sp.]|nr:sterol desaturase family protein [Rubellimicrobium sp.]
MDDSAYGTRDKRGNWTPDKPYEYAPVFVWPPRPRAFLKFLLWMPGYFLPWNLLYALIVLAMWVWLTPPLEVMQTLAPGWILFLLARNAALSAIWYGGFHFWLYIRRAQQKAFKYNGKWPEEGNADAFLFKSQLADNLFWTFVFGIPIWTAFEVLGLWLYANGMIPWLDPREHPVWFVVIWMLIPLYREFHFYLIHRLIHWPPLYRTVHKVHHNSINPTPWSGLAMHPVEQLLYFSGVILYWVIPAHPIHTVYHLAHCMFASAPGHVGFDKVAVGDEGLIDMPGYDHYLHHKYFECNYSDGVVPYDKWFGTFHDGSPESEKRMMERFRRKKARRSAAAGGASS